MITIIRSWVIDHIIFLFWITHHFFNGISFHDLGKSKLSKKTYSNNNLRSKKNIRDFGKAKYFHENRVSEIKSPPHIWNANRKQKSSVESITRAHTNLQLCERKFGFWSFDCKKKLQKWIKCKCEAMRYFWNSNKSSSWIFDTIFVCFLSQIPIHYFV